MNDQDITTTINLQESFSAALTATQPLDQAAPQMLAVTPSQLLNGGKAPATVENWKKLGFS